MQNGLSHRSIYSLVCFPWHRGRGVKVMDWRPEPRHLVHIVLIYRNPAISCVQFDCRHPLRSTVHWRPCSCFPFKGMHNLKLVCNLAGRSVWLNRVDLLKVQAYLGSRATSTTNTHDITEKRIYPKGLYAVLLLLKRLAAETPGTVRFSESLSIAHYSCSRTYSCVSRKFERCIFPH